MTDLHYVTRPDGARLALFRQSPRQSSGRSVLIVHGATFPTSLSSAYRIDGRSWFDALCATGFEAWGLDFQGFGASDPFAEGGDGPTPGRAVDAAMQVAAAIDFIRGKSPGAALSLIAHSWGTVPAGLVLSQRPGVVDRAVFYGPVVAGDRGEPAAEEAPRFLEVSRDAQWAAFAAGVPEGVEAPVGRAEFARWSEAYVPRVPAGPMVDIGCARRGALPYDPASIETPMLVVRGSWDAVTTEADSIRFFHQLVRARARRLTWIHGGTHRMHLERGRGELFAAAEAFLLERG